MYHKKTAPLASMGSCFFTINHSIMRKEILLLFSLLCLPLLLLAQEKGHESKKDTHLNDVVNTLKERVTLSGYVQTVYTYDDAETASNNTFEIRRAILMAQGQITDRWLCYFMYSFANTGKILEAYTEYKFLPELTVRLGEFKTRFSLENPLSPTVVELIDCESQAVAYYTGYSGNPLYGSTSGRDIGILVTGDLFKQLLHYDLSVINGQGINQKDKNPQKDVVGRVIVQPLKWLSVSGSFLTGKGNAAAAYDANPDIKAGDNYNRDYWTVGALVKSKPIDLRTEYLAGKDNNVKSEGFYATLSAHVLPKFDIIASYDYFNKNKTLEDKQTKYVAGVQYWFYPRCRLQAQYTYRDSHKNGSSNVIQAQVQVRF